ncbi:MAG: hypothetical protein ACTS9Y_00315 [Methylophilus sp.]|uniref:hypothetical protein n=1 Tax=Methylophilus sp. TaxID=29541 RepID=UPI003F9F212D
MWKLIGKVNPGVTVCLAIVLAWLIYGICIGPGSVSHLWAAVTTEIEHRSFTQILDIFTKVHPVSVAVVSPLVITLIFVCLGSLESMIVVVASLVAAMASLIFTNFSVLSIFAVGLCLISFLAYFIEVYRRTYREHQLLIAAND